MDSRVDTRTTINAINLGRDSLNTNSGLYKRLKTLLPIGKTGLPVHRSREKTLLDW